MASVNKVIIVGNLGNDPEIRQFQNGNKVAHLSVATSERWTDKMTGEQKEQTEWHRISLYNRLAEIAEQYLRKGSSVYVEGSLHTRKWTDQQNIERYTTEIKANAMQMLSPNPNARQPNRPSDQFAPQTNYNNHQTNAAPSYPSAPVNQPPAHNYPSASHNPAPSNPPMNAPRNDLGSNQFAPNQNINNNTGDDDIPF